MGVRPAYFGVAAPRCNRCPPRCADDAAGAFRRRRQSRMIWPQQIWKKSQEANSSCRPAADVLIEGGPRKFGDPFFR